MYASKELRQKKMYRNINNVLYNTKSGQKSSTNPDPKRIKTKVLNYFTFFCWKSNGGVVPPIENILHRKKGEGLHATAFNFASICALLALASWHRIAEPSTSPCEKNMKECAG